MKATNVGGKVIVLPDDTVPGFQSVFVLEPDGRKKSPLGLHPPQAANARAGEQSGETARHGGIDCTGDLVNKLLW